MFFLFPLSFLSRLPWTCLVCSAWAGTPLGHTPPPCLPIPSCRAVITLAAHYTLHHGTARGIYTVLKYITKVLLYSLCLSLALHTHTYIHTHVNSPRCKPFRSSPPPPPPSPNKMAKWLWNKSPFPQTVVLEMLEVITQKKIIEKRTPPPPS